MILLGIKTSKFSVFGMMMERVVASLATFTLIYILVQESMVMQLTLLSNLDI